MTTHPSIPRRSAAASALMLTATILTAACAAAVSPINIEAARIEARVKTALVNDQLIGTRVINVRMLGSVAQLSGQVSSQDEAERAADVARSVPGVTGVDLRIQIGSDTNDAAAAAEPRADPIRGPAYEFAELLDEPNLLALGAGLAFANQQGPAAGTRVDINPIVRLGAGNGFGPAVAFEWYHARAAFGADTPIDSGGIRVRPIMGGVRYTVPLGRVAISPSLVAGYAFNSIRVPDEGDASELPVAVDNSFIWRPGVALWFDAGHRTLVHMSIGRALTSPRVTAIENGRLQHRSVSADTTVVLLGVAFRVF